MRDTLERLERAVERIAPAYLRDWSYGCAFKDCNRLEATLHRNLPEDARTYLMWHNGDRRHELQRGGFWLGLELLSVDEIISAWESWKTTAQQTGALLDDTQRSVPAGAIQERYAHDGWVPFARDGRGSYLALDLAPGPHGCEGQIINLGREDSVRYVVAGGIRAFWQRMLVWIESGRLKVGTERDAYPDDDGALDETTPYLWWPKRGVWSLSSILPEFSGALEPLVDAVCDADEDWFDTLTAGWRAVIAESTGHSRAPNAIDVASLLTLNLHGPDVADLEPARKFPNLRELNLSGTAVTDLSPVRDIPHLTSLGLSNTPVRDLSALAGLATLRQLTARETHVVDISPLGSCRALTHLDLASTPFEDAHQLDRMSDLRVLDLAGTRVVNVKPVMGCGRLEWLSIASTEVDDLRPLAGHASLRHIDIENTPVRDIDPLLDIPALRSVSLSGAAIEDLSLLDWIPGLMEVACDFAAFDVLRTVMQGSYRISLRGDLTPKRKLVWDEWQRRARQ